MCCDGGTVPLIKCHGVHSTWGWFHRLSHQRDKTPNPHVNTQVTTWKKISLHRALYQVSWLEEGYKNEHWYCKLKSKPYIHLISHKGGKTGTATAAVPVPVLPQLAATPYQDLVVKNVTAPGFPPAMYCVDLIAHLSNNINTYRESSHCSIWSQSSHNWGNSILEKKYINPSKFKLNYLAMSPWATIESLLDTRFYP